MQLMLSRHGNTFDPGDKVVMCGTQNDVPLVTEGGNQAERLGEALRQQGITPSIVCCSELCRTQRYAEIVMEKLGIPGDPIVDPRLNELDYGDWTGLTHPEIVEKYGEEEVEAYEQNRIWPQNGSWGENEQSVQNRVESFAKDILKFAEPDDVILAVTHGGLMRYFLDLAPGELENRIEAGTTKIKTGHVCKLTQQKDKSFNVSYWNVDPRDAQKL